METNSIHYTDKISDVDAGELTRLYTGIGWNREGYRTPEKTKIMLEDSKYFVAAYSGTLLVGFGRILADPYIAQILDVMVLPEFRKKGVATEILNKIRSHCENRYIGVSLIDGSGLAGFYEKFGFEAGNPGTERIMYWDPNK
ncbi:GNAT family N-acetyltransferase [bacterium]|nr:GNAT family N-acetyltransferase [bacterium]